MIGAEVVAIVASGLLGALAGGSFSLWRAIKEQEDKCAFLADMRTEICSGFKSADAVLSDPRAPSAVKALLFYLLEAYADDEVGKKLASTVFRDDEPTGEVLDSNPFAAGMRTLADIDPALARAAHRALGALSMGLFVVHFGDGITAKRVQRELASDPVSIWSRLGALVTGSHSGSRGGTTIHA